jgi:hypothetical protein
MSGRTWRRLVGHPASGRASSVWSGVQRLVGRPASCRAFGHRDGYRGRYNHGDAQAVAVKRPCWPSWTAGTGSAPGPTPGRAPTRLPWWLPIGSLDSEHSESTRRPAAAPGRCGLPTLASWPAPRALAPGPGTPEGLRSSSGCILRRRRGITHPDDGVHPDPSAEVAGGWRVLAPATFALSRLPPWGDCPAWTALRVDCSPHGMAAQQHAARWARALIEVDVGRTAG